MQDTAINQLSADWVNHEDAPIAALAQAVGATLREREERGVA